MNQLLNEADVPKSRDQGAITPGITHSPSSDVNGLGTEEAPQDKSIFRASTWDEPGLESSSDADGGIPTQEIMARTRLRIARLRKAPVADVEPPPSPSTPSVLNAGSGAQTPLGSANSHEYGASTPAPESVPASVSGGEDEEPKAADRPKGTNAALEARLRTQAQLRVRLARARREASLREQLEIRKRG
jgi:hypothetical protein